MGVRTVWLDDEHSVLGYLFEGNWTWDEMRRAIQQADTLMSTVDHAVDFIADTRGVGLIPSDVVTNFRELAVSSPPHPNYGGLTVFVGTNTLIRNLLNMASNIYRQLNQYHRFVFVATTEEAYTMIAEHRAGKRSA
jgi:hypothetical protein